MGTLYPGRDGEQREIARDSGDWMRDWKSWGLLSGRAGARMMGKCVGFGKENGELVLPWAL